MEPTSLNRLIQEGGIELTPEGLIVNVKSFWIIEGEDRLSYTTLIRLIECCREHHWNVEILPWMRDDSIDSITKTITGEFLSVIPSGSVIWIEYKVIHVGQRSYTLRFQVRDKNDKRLYASFDLVQVFYDPLRNKSVHPPELVIEHLCAISTF